MAVAKQIVFVVCFSIFSMLAKSQNKYALLIGINDYYEVKGIKSDVSLHGSVNDANSIRDLLINKFDFKSANIDTLYDAAATRDNIVEALNKKLKECKRGDAMVFYYSGHGVYLYNSDEAKDSIKRGMNQAMLTSDLYNYDDHLKCFLRDFSLKKYFNLFIDKKIVLTTIFDCCFSGNLAMADPHADLSERTKSIDVQDLIGRLVEKKSDPQLFIDSITGMPTGKVQGCLTDSTGEIIDKTDSDEDGVPDCRDKEKFTPKECNPVNRDGVGSCSFDYMLQAFQKTLDRYDASEFKNRNVNSIDRDKAFSATAVLNISEKDTIQRPVYRKDSRFLFISATNDVQKAVEFKDENGVIHSFFTASIMRVFKNAPPDVPVEDLFQKIVDDMNGYHRNQNPTLYSDPLRKKNNLIGIKLQK
ncbi:MAG TPA: caspase family protein [Puia sp.]|nr:caspase family protein [Puia sp.]